MDMKVYKKTRYQNIYKHKNGNYVICVNKPVKSSISRIDGQKIWKIDEALKIRDNPKTGLQKKAEIIYKENIDHLWDKYINWCKNIDKQSYNNVNKKILVYNKHIRNKIKKPISKLTTDDFVNIIKKADTTDKQRNHILKNLKAFLNWCVKENIIIYNPTSNIRFYKTSKAEMKYWTTDEIKEFFEYINKQHTETAYRVKMLVLIGFTLGDRIGETRALSFGNIKNNLVSIKHSINYDSNSSDFLSNTKTYGSQRTIDVSDNFMCEINNYRDYLISLGYNITDNTLIFLNHNTKKPFSDSKLRTDFYNYCDLANVKRIRLYDLRHTYVATMMEEGKELYFISERLGHSSYSTTVNKYGHLSNKKRKEIAKITDKYTS